jgi:hypothetical protein
MSPELGATAVADRIEVSRAVWRMRDSANNEFALTRGAKHVGPLTLAIKTKRSACWAFRWALG